MMIDSDRPTGELPAVMEDESRARGDSLDQLADYDEFDGTAAEVPGAKTSRIVGLGFIWAAIRRRTRLWVSLGVLGLVIGGGLFVTTKPVYQSTATILMVNDPTIDTPTAMMTDALLADNPTFAQQALNKLKQHETVAEFLRDYTVTVVSNQLLSIAVNAPTAAEAASRADVLSNQYLAFRAGVLQQQLAQMNAASALQVAKAQTALTAVGKQVS